MSKGSSRKGTYLDRLEGTQQVVGWGPPLLEDVQADLAVLVDVRVKHAFGVDELNFWRLIRVGLFQLNCEMKDSALPLGVIWSEYESLPLCQVVHIEVNIDI
jgi:hypothetical protein